MENIAPSGDPVAPVQPIPLECWSAALIDPANTLEVNRNFFGHAVRTDQWKCRQFKRTWHTVYLVLDGEAVGVVGDRPYRLGANSLFWLSPDVPHDMQWSKRIVFTEVWFRLTRGSQSLRFVEPVIIEDGAESIWPVMQLIEQELLQAGPMSELKLRHLLALMAIDVVQLRQTSDDAALLSPAQRRRLDQYARKNITRRPSPSELAEVVGLSPDYFSRIFRRTYGTPPRDWLIRERIREASRMLTSTTLATYQVADHLGYANVSQFSRQFSQAMGMSPGRYRRQN